MAIPICPGITYTMVGIETDAQAQVLDAKATPIPGLFAAGATTGGLEGGKDTAYIGGLIKSGSFGLLAAERIAALAGKSVLPEIVESTVLSDLRQAVGHATRTGHAGPVKGASTAKGLERFPVLRATVRYGRGVAVGLSLLVAALVFALSSEALGWLGGLLAVVSGLLVLVIILGVVELIKLITEFLMPE